MFHFIALSLLIQPCIYYRAMKFFLDKDRSTYGTSQAFEIVEEEADGWLDEVDSAVMRGSK